jgi:hypothetical protein
LGFAFLELAERLHYAMSAAPRTSDAARERQLRNARQRRWYARQHPRRRERVALVPVADAVVQMLVDLNWLREADADDRAKIALAIEAMLADAACAHERRFT